VNVSNALRLLGVVITWVALLASLFLIEKEPLFGVLGILGAMALLLACLQNSPETGLERLTEFEQSLEL
jgi:hypothetical protein